MKNLWQTYIDRKVLGWAFGVLITAYAFFWQRADAAFDNYMEFNDSISRYQTSRIEELDIKVGFAESMKEAQTLAGEASDTIILITHRLFDRDKNLIPIYDSISELLTTQEIKLIKAKAITSKYENAILPRGCNSQDDKLMIDRTTILLKQVSNELDHFVKNPDEKYSPYIDSIGIGISKLYEITTKQVRKLDGDKHIAKLTSKNYLSNRTMQDHKSDQLFDKWTSSKSYLFAIVSIICLLVALIIFWGIAPSVSI